MSTARQTKKFTSDDQQGLAKLAAGSAFFFAQIKARMGSGAHPRQYEVFTEARDRDAWRKGAKTICSVAVRNRYETDDGRPICGSRQKP